MDPSEPTTTASGAAFPPHALAHRSDPSAGSNFRSTATLGLMKEAPVTYTAEPSGATATSRGVLLKNGSGPSQVFCHAIEPSEANFTTKILDGSNPTTLIPVR